MNKIAAYLQEHISGEVVTHPSILASVSHDASILEISPQMVVYPGETNDIRKIARFTWQLAEKGHTIPITARGYGGDQTGGAIGPGIVLSLTTHLQGLMEYDSKQKLVRVQTGMNSGNLATLLEVYGLYIPSLPEYARYSTVGGLVAAGSRGSRSGKYGGIGDWVHRLEVVLANGEVLQTGRISRRELNQKKGLQTFEGEVYRNLDALLEDSADTIEHLRTHFLANLGYSPIVSVKNRDGSIDLTPLFVGSQGTLGIISELIMKTLPKPKPPVVVIAAIPEVGVACQALKAIRDLQPSMLDYYEAGLFRAAASRGKKYGISDLMLEHEGAVIVMEFDEHSERANKRKLKKVQKILAASGAIVEFGYGDDGEALRQICTVTSYVANPSETDTAAPPLFDGVRIPPEYFGNFSESLKSLAKKYAIDDMPLHGRILDDTYYARPVIPYKTTGDRQKMLKLLGEYSQIVTSCAGQFIADCGEGRVKSMVAYNAIDEQVAELFMSIKAIFDPYNLLNPGVKQAPDTKANAFKVRAVYDTANAPHEVSYY